MTEEVIMSARNLILYIIIRNKKLLLVKAIEKTSLWALPGGHASLTRGLTHAARGFLRPYFRDLFIYKVEYIRAPVEDIKVFDKIERIIIVGCKMRATIKKKIKNRVWFVDPTMLVSHAVIPGTLELLSLPEIQSRLA